MNTVDSYHFGKMVINGRNYRSDLIVSADSVNCGWRRRRSHELAVADIGEALAAHPDVLVVGTGASGLLKVLPEVEQAAGSQGMEVIVAPTREACRTYNQRCGLQRVVAAFHLTC
ncbi:Mth938-like domain-containing protein [Chloroflexota bacterium]